MWQEYGTHAIQVGHVFETKNVPLSDVNVVDSVTFELVPKSDDDSTRNNERVSVCHNNHTITISENAVPAHLRHGDVLGECDDDTRNDDLQLQVDQLVKENESLSQENQQLRKQVDELTKRIQDLQTVVMEQIKVIMDTLSSLKLQ